MISHEEHAEKLGAKVKHYPPMRPKAETELLWQHVAGGRCTFVSSDHVSWGLERKGDPNIFKNTSGGRRLGDALTGVLDWLRRARDWSPDGGQDALRWPGGSFLDW